MAITRRKMPLTEEEKLAKLRLKAARGHDVAASYVLWLLELIEKQEQFIERLCGAD